MDGHGLVMVQVGSGVGEEMWRWEMRAEITSSGHRLATILSKIKNSEKARDRPCSTYACKDNG